MFINMFDIKEAAQKLNNGFIVAFPTETVYGLGADATNKEAVARIFGIKNRPKDHPLIVHLGSINQLQDWAIDIPKYAIELAQAFWPGPMTLILKRNRIAKDFVTGGQETVGLRIPNHEMALSLLEEFKKFGSGAIAAPSANKFGKVSPTSFEHVKSELGKDLSQEDLIIDGGNSLVGIESTIIDCTGPLPKVLRPGAITDKMIEELTGMFLSNRVSNIRVSGSFISHYAPSAKVVLDVEPKEGDGFIALAQIETPNGVTRLIAPRSNEEFAQELYSAFHIADQMNLSRIVVISPQGDDLAIAIRDRLLKASNGK